MVRSRNQLLKRWSIFLIIVSLAFLVSQAVHAAAFTGPSNLEGMAIRVEPLKTDTSENIGEIAHIEFSSQITSSGSLEIPNFGNILIISAVPIVLIFSMAKVLEKKSQTQVLTNRQSILRLVQNTPGIHFNEICRILNIQNGVTQYHLKNLENDDTLIKSYQDGVYHRYFPNKYELTSNERSMEVLSLLQRPGMGSIMKILWLSETPMSRDNLATEIGITQQGAGWNCKQLISYNILSEQKIGKQKFYSLEPKVMNTLNDLAQYVPSPSEYYI